MAQFEYSLLREAAWLGDRVEASEEREGGTSLVPKYGQSRLIYGIWDWLGEILVAILALLIQPCAPRRSNKFARRLENLFGNPRL